MSAGIYVLNVGDKSVEFTAKLDKGARDKTVELTIPNVRRRIDLQSSPVWEVKRGLGLDATALTRLRASVEAIMDNEDLMRVLNITANDFRQLEASVELKLPRTPLNRLKRITPKQIESLERLGIGSVQDLWKEVKKEKRRQRVAQEAKIATKVISEWIDHVDTMRSQKDV